MPAESSESKPFMPRWAVYLLLPGLVLPVGILIFIFVSELAHDEDRCPYRIQSSRVLSDGSLVREDARSCLPGVEERRFSAVRGGEERVIGRRRFGSAAFGEGYRWTAEVEQDGAIRVIVDNPEHAQAAFKLPK